MEVKVCRGCKHSHDLKIVGGLFCELTESMHYGTRFDKKCPINPTLSDM